MNDLDALDDVLARARAGLSPSDEQVERVWGGLSPAAAGTGSGSPRLSPNPPLPSRRWAAVGARFGRRAGSQLAAAALLVGTGFVAGYWAHALLPAQAPALALAPANQTAPSASHSPPALAPREPITELRAAPQPVAPAQVSGAPPALRTNAQQRASAASTSRLPVAAHASDPAAELSLLERIERALRNADGALAQVLLDELEREHPKTRLAEERRAARRMANCLTEADGAPAAAQAFLRAEPASVYANRLRALCKLE